MARLRYCQDCLFWDEFHPGSGICRRHAPQVGEAFQPVTAFDCWCGEGRDKPRLWLQMLREKFA